MTNRPLHSYRQMKLTNGDELVCEVVQWNDDQNDEVVIKNAMRLAMYESGTGEKFFSFRPYMMYQEGEEDLIVLLCTHIISIAIPIEPLLFQYRTAMNDMHKTHDERIRGAKKDMSLDDLQRMTRDTLHKLSVTQTDLEDYLMELESMPRENDSDGGGGRVIDLFTKKTIH